jgi:carboxypeptidase C (cathepsin A)
MDNPVDVGFSHTGNENGYVTSAEGAAKDIYEFMSQFIALFPHLQRNPFYNAGASFGANYAVHSAFYIHQQNLDNPTRFINLTGVIVDSPWIDPYTQSHYGDYLYGVGLINEKNRDEFIANETRIRSLIDEDKYLEAFQLAIQTSMVNPAKLTGYTAMSNIIHETPPFINMTAFTVANSTRKALHVGSLDFKFISQEQQSRMHSNFMRSAKPKLDALLEAGYKFLIYVGNMDVTTNHLGVQKMLQTLSWSGGRDLADGTREIWRVNNKLAGYRTSSGKGTMAIIRNAGHGCSADQPEEVLDVVNMFIESGN